MNYVNKGYFTLRICRKILVIYTFNFTNINFFVIYKIFLILKFLDLINKFQDKDEIKKQLNINTEILALDLWQVI